jgi:hypothetical protein
VNVQEDPAKVGPFLASQGLKDVPCIVDQSGIVTEDLGIGAGPGMENLSIDSLSFWAEDDGTPAGLTLQASFDQKFLGTPTHETLTLDIDIDALSGVTITAPVS